MDGESKYQMNRNGNSQSGAALVVAHPSHELCVHGWLQASRPAVFVLTDVVGDSDEGYSPTHDVCRLLTNAALEMIRRRSGRQVANFDFAVVGAPDECPPQIRNKAVWIHLDDDAFSAKLLPREPTTPNWRSMLKPRCVENYSREYGGCPGRTWRAKSTMN